VKSGKEDEMAGGKMGGEMRRGRRDKVRVRFKREISSSFPARLEKWVTRQQEAHSCTDGQSIFESKIKVSSYNFTQSVYMARRNHALRTSRPSTGDASLSRLHRYHSLSSMVASLEALPHSLAIL
jgi:hypothetical protein